MDVRSAVDEIRAHGSDMQWWRKRFLTRVVSRYFEANPPEATPLCRQDWDNVILLDACRYDLFEEVYTEHPLPGKLSMRRSVESGTPGYLRENFSDETFHDVVYVTANPYVNTELPKGTFHAVDPVWKDGWDDENQTVRPETVRDRALAASERYPNKRLIVHFNQPHTPFIGERRIESRGIDKIRATALGKSGPDPASRRRTAFERLGDGEVSRMEVWAAYRDNLKVAWPAVETLLNEFAGRTVVTADHGNALGERAWPFPIRVYGHPLGIPIPALTEVPWLVNQRGERKQVTAHLPERESSPSVDTKERLRMLGYAE